MKVMSVVGARPNFMKIAPFIRAVEAYKRVGGGRWAEDRGQKANFFLR